jgi:von Willebrand factor type A domain
MSTVVAAHVVWLTPAAALVALAALVPIAAWLVGERRVRAARETLRLRSPRRRTWWAPAAIAATLVLVGVAAAQPVLASPGGGASRRTGQVFVVLDTSTSMLAGRPTRFSRAVAAARRLRDALPATPVGLASMTDRVLPHMFPSIDRDDYLATLDEAVGVDRPPPGRPRRQASGFDALSVLGSARFFSGGQGSRVVVVLTDGETRAVDAASLASAFGRARIYPVFVQFWKSDERIAGDAAYRPDAAAAAEMQALATRLRAPVFREERTAEAIDAVDRALGPGRSARPRDAASTTTPLAPYAMIAALVPLALLIWRRNVR